MHSDNEMVRLRDVVETLIYMTDEDSDGVEEVMQLPTIDIVCCGECKYGGTEDCPMDEIDDEYFCNFGEREGE